VFLTVVVAIWNFNAIRHLFKTAPKTWHTYALGGAMVPVFLCWSVLNPVLFRYPRLILMATYLTAAGISFLAFRVSSRRGLRHYAVPAYNVLGLLVLAVWVCLDEMQDVPSYLAPLGYASGLTQALNFFSMAVFMPVFFLPPILLRLEKEDKPVLSHRGRISIKTVGWGLGKAISATAAYFVGFIVITASIGAANILSFDGDHGGFEPRPGMSFAIVAKSLTTEQSPRSDWQGELAREVAAAKELGLDYIRYDIRSEMVEDSMAEVENASAYVRAEGLGLMLGLYGRDSWPGGKPASFEAYCAQIESDARAVAPHADYVLPYYEPNGQARIVLGREASPEMWRGAVERATMQIRNASSAKVLIEIARDGSALALIQEMQNAGVDAIGLDIYPASWEDMAWVEECAASVDRSLVPEVWLSEFGMECSMFGDRTQARFITMAVAQASRLNLTGCCLWAPQDDTGMGHPPLTMSHLGIVRADWSRRQGFSAYAEAISASRG
jgi:hypothetical protein